MMSVHNFQTSDSVASKLIVSFVILNGKPLTRYQFGGVLTMCRIRLGLPRGVSLVNEEGCVGLIY